jgi:U3 small nucleolar RNA-associated protein 13
LVSGSGDSTVKIWNLVGILLKKKKIFKDGECLYTLQGHVNSVLKVSFICESLQVLSGFYNLIKVGGDGLIKLWNYKKNICTTTIDKHQGKIWAMDVKDD